MKRVFTLMPSLVVVAMLAFLASCSAPQKYSYNFSKYQYRKAQPVAEAQPKTTTPLETEVSQVVQEVAPAPSASLVASTKPAAPIAVKASTNAVPNKVEAPKHELKTEVGEYSNKEKRQIRKEFKNNIKTYKKAVRAGDSVKAAKAAEALKAGRGDYLRMGIIIGAAGLLVAILAGSGTIAAIGWIGFLVGIVLIVLGLIG